MSGGPSDRHFEGKTVVLTGASGGIGLALSREFAKQGANIIAIARSQTKLNAWATEMAPFGIQTVTIIFDLSQTNQFFSLTCQILDAIHQLRSSNQKNKLQNQPNNQQINCFCG